MVHAIHFILSAYGFWLPNDPRGSWSDFVASWELLRYGKVSKVDHTRSVAHVEHDRDLRRRAKDALKHAPVHFTGLQARAVSRGFGRAVGESGYPVHACSILDDHVHLVVGRSEYSPARIVTHLKGRAMQQLSAEHLHPFSDSEGGSTHSPWAAKYWKVFIDEPQWVRSAIRYVQENPLKEGKREQSWDFVSEWRESSV